MRSPFRSEAAAYRLLLATALAFGAVAVADRAGGASVALVVWAAATAAVLLAYVVPGRRARPLRSAPAHVGAAEERRVLVLAPEPLPPGALAAIRGRADRVLVVAPVEAPALRRWLSDVDAAREDARRRADDAAARLRAAGADATASVGDADPLRAVEDALRTFGGDEVLVSAGEHGAELADRLRERFALPAAPLAS